MSTVLLCPKCGRKSRANLDRIPIVRCPNCSHPLTIADKEEVVSTIERKYILTRLDAGDYLLPGNSGTTLWRIAKGEEEREDMSRYTVWQVWQAPVRMVARMRDGTMDPSDLEWSEWELFESFCKTRDEAVQSALKEDAKNVART